MYIQLIRKLCTHATLAVLHILETHHRTHNPNPIHNLILNPINCLNPPKSLDPLKPIQVYLQILIMELISRLQLLLQFIFHPQQLLGK